MGCFIRSVGHNSLYLWKFFRYFVVNLIKGYAVMDITGSHHSLQHKAVLVAGGMGFIRKLPLVLSLYE